MDGQHIDWYVVRATGFVAWGLATACVLHGLLHASRRRVRRPRPSWVLDVHSFLAALTCVVTVMHVGALLFDRFVGFGVVDVVVPYATRWHPGAVAWGIVAADLMVVVELTSLVRARMSRRLWHAVHCSAFVVFAAATVHALRAGTDRHATATRAFAVAATVAVLAAAVTRVVLAARAPHATRPVAGHRPAPTLVPVEAAIEEVVRGAARRRRVARHGHHRVGAARGAPR